ncbi:4-hydroxy-2-oxoheptanedioate aldolase [Lichenicoccus sp.]|uniref:4-hydroxy-2-oxoheptanedioate aldolase n=1 Tax=Lichenicoccus sp. TaxID=2781899 RepID=UPI003D0AF295
MAENRENRFKTRLLQGDLQIGLWLALADPYAAELCAGAGFDWLLIDAEHAPNDNRSILSQLQAIAPYGSQPVVRPPTGESWMIKQLLDLGVETLLVPMVETASQAADIVAATRYPPHGIRGVGSAIARASRWGADESYLADANERMCVLLQIESRTGLENLEAIAAVPGVDGVFIGPADLSASMGFLGNPGADEMVAAIEGAIRRIRQSGRAAGILSTDQATAHGYIALGCRFVAVGVDTALLAGAGRALAAGFMPGGERLQGV